MFQVRAATAADRPEILAMIHEMIPGVDAEARWRWLYESNPAGRALSWIATQDGVVAGCTSFFPFRLWLDGELVRAALGGDGYVKPLFRRQGVGGLLHEAARAAMETHGIGCMYGAPGAMNLTPLKHSGSRELGHVARWVRPVRVSVLGLRVPWFDRLPVPKARGAPTLEPMQPGDPRVDDVWAHARQSLPLAAVRDAAFYTWRFLASPSRRQAAFVIVQRGRPIGACALEPTNGGATLRIIDLVTVPDAWHASLRTIVRYAGEHTQAESIDIKLFVPDGRRRQMWRTGFSEREGKPFLCVIPSAGDRRFLAPDRWYYSGADSDLDSFDDDATVRPRRSSQRSLPLGVLGSWRSAIIPARDAADRADRVARRQAGLRPPRPRRSRDRGPPRRAAPSRCSTGSYAPDRASLPRCSRAPGRSRGTTATPRR
jgi:GNAT superfamily N-acetyltransferase